MPNHALHLIAATPASLLAVIGVGRFYKIGLSGLHWGVTLSSGG
jgi:hypothetical protein